MCGFVGFRSYRDFDELRERLPNAAARLLHRGPDDAGLFYDEQAGVGLAHRRLSIIDLSSAGRQPMVSDDGAVYIVYNGEVYNFKVIRNALVRYGHRFRSATDTEVVLKAYLQWDMECLSRFIGMFSLAIWDSRQQLVILARDRLGIKPLYYHFKKGNLLFASELKALMAFAGFPKEIDSEALALFLHYQYIPAPKTIFRDTCKLLPGQYLTYDGERLTAHTYWRLPDERMAVNCVNRTDEVYLEELDELLALAVSDRLISDVPLGALLSGGIDSSIVVAQMKKISGSPVQTFTIGFEEAEYNEAPWASKIASHLGTDHTGFYVTAKEALEVIPRLPDIYDEPFADSSAVPTFLVCQLARTHVTVALSGDGGDEQFAGYVRYWSTQAMAKLLKSLPQALREFLVILLTKIPCGWIEKCYVPWRRVLPQRFQVGNFVDKWEKLLSQMGAAQIADLYRTTISYWSEEELAELTGLPLTEGIYEEIFKQTEGWPIISRLMRVDQGTYLPDAMLTKADRASMAVSLEVRLPLLDHRVVEFTSKLPYSANYRNGRGKYLSRRLLARYLPSQLFERPKMGFGIPIDRWFRDGLRDLLLDYLSSDRLRTEGLFDQTVIEKKIREHLSGVADHQYRLWPVLIWEMWRERWLKGQQ